ncbi:SPOC domain-like protein [Polychaeton citri CBS 116435]|uniref:ATP-dependent DNA helicase II subunit 2 n=1 Tax=Polychaeton citri CBS 116435 TaxID=1314669 RepID=A0A9P4UKV4_9PEZI|nr:SPOC domain-like protein [Polychaeton citri CBS 116435]
MAQKEATVYIVDVGRSMAEIGYGRDKSNLDWALEYVYDKITTTVATGRKTALAGIVALRTDEARNEYSDDEAYDHISVVQEIVQIQMPELRGLRHELVVNGCDIGDAMSALAIAVQMISKQCRKLQYQRKIVLVTDGRAAMDAEDMSQIVKKIREDNIELVVLGTDFDDADYGFKEESKDTVKAGNEAIFKRLCDDCDGLFGTLAQAIEELGIPRLKTTKPVPSFKGLLTLGSLEDYPDTAIGINVERYPKTMVARAPTASSFVVRADMAAGEVTQSSATLVEDGTEEGAIGANTNGLTSVKNARTYQVADEKAPGGMKDILQEDLSRGYEYGRTAVHISESDRNVTDYETSSGLEIMGFVEKGRYERYMDMSRANLIVASRADEKASMALSSVVRALYELESYAVARYVAKDNKGPLLLLLVPNIEPDLECLYDIELPFAEDVRSYKFPPLASVVTVSGKILKIHRNLPSDDLMDAVSDYVDSMDLSVFGKDDEGGATEYAPPDETFSPMLHRINQVIKHRAIFPDEPPPQTYEILTRYSTPPSELAKQSQATLDRIIEAGDIKKVPPKARGKRGRGGKRDQDKPLSDLDVDALLAADPKRSASSKKISDDNAIPEFKQLLNKATSSEDIIDAIKQLGQIVKGWVDNSVGSSSDDRVIEVLGVMRRSADELDESDAWNEFLRGLKTKLLGGSLGGEKRELFAKLKWKRLGLVDAEDGEQKNFWKMG